MVALVGEADGDDDGDEEGKCLLEGMDVDGSISNVKPAVAARTVSFITCCVIMCVRERVSHIADNVDAAAIQIDPIKLLPQGNEKHHASSMSHQTSTRKGALVYDGSID